MDRAMQERLVGASILVLIAVLLIPWLLDGSAQPVGQHSSERELILPGSPGSGTETRTISLDAPNRGGSVNPPSAVDTRSIKEVAASSSGSQSSNGQDSSSQAMLSSNSTDTRAVEAKPAASGSASTGSDVALNQQAESGNVATAKDPAAVAKPASNTVSEVAGTAADASPPATFSTPMPNETSAPRGALGWAVQVGSFARQENAERLAEHLRDKKYKAFVMRNVVEGRVRFRVRVGPVKERADADLLAAALAEDRQPAKVLQHP